MSERMGRYADADADCLRRVDQAGAGHREHPIASALGAYRVFADKKAGGMKVELRP
jgi:hypothetical protein